MKTARRIAVDLLSKMDENNAYSNELLDSAIRSGNLSKQDKKLLTRLFYGVLENRIRIDYYIEKLSKIRLKKIHIQTLNTLRIAIYQIVFMDNIPVSAAVNESVNIANRTNKRSAGFVNGILRNFVRSFEKGLLPLPTDSNKASYLSVKYSLPVWLVESLLEQFYFDTVELMAESNNQPPPLSIRVNTLKTNKSELAVKLSALGIITAESRHANDGLLIVEAEGESPNSNPLFDEGLYYIQDEASMMVSEFLSPESGDSVFDLCAAPGGKTTHIAQLTNQTGLIKAFDLHKHRVSDIKDNASRLGIGNIEAIHSNSSIIDESLVEGADKILLDVPCSGIGILRRKPELRYRLESDDLNALQTVQAKLLDNASRYVKNDGCIVYSTCTVNYDENDKIILDFISRNANFKLVDISNGRYESLHKSSYESVKEAVHTYPHRDGTDGFFICKLQKICI